MANMICALVMTRKLASIIMIATAAVIMLLIVLCGPKNKATAKYNAELDEQKEKDEQPAEQSEQVVEEVVEEQPVADAVVEEIAEPTAEPVVEESVEPVVEEVATAEVAEQETVAETEEVAESVEEVVKVEPATEEVVEEAIPVTLEEPVSDEPQQPACSNDPAEEVVAVDAEVAKTKLNIPVGKKRTFAEKMLEADEENQAVYNLLKNELMSYKKVSNRLTKVIDIFKHKGTYLAKVGLTGKTVKLHLALDPNEYAVTKYHHQDLGEKKKYEFVPLALKVKSPRSQKYALELIAGVMEKAGIAKNPKYQQTDYIAAMKQAQQPADEQ